MPSPSQGPRLEAALSWGALGLLVLSGLASLLFQLQLPSRQASDGDYRQVAEVLAREAAPGDAVLLFPWWAERARLFLPNGLPVVGYLHSESDPLVEHPRIWVLAEPRLPRNDAKGFEAAFLPGRALEGKPRAFGGLTLALYRNGRHRPVLFSAVQAIGQAHVYLERPDGARDECPWNGSAHQCPGGLRVAAEWHELFYQPRYCVWMHPPGGSTRLVAEFADVPGSDSLLLEGGIIWELAPKRDVTPLQVGVEDAAGGAALAHLTVPGGTEGMQAAAFHVSGRPGGLRLWTQSDQPEARDACVELRAFGPSKERHEPPG